MQARSEARQAAQAMSDAQHAAVSDVRRTVSDISHATMQQRPPLSRVQSSAASLLDQQQHTQQHLQLQQQQMLEQQQAQQQQQLVKYSPQAIWMLSAI